MNRQASPERTLQYKDIPEALSLAKTDKKPASDVTFHTIVLPGTLE